MTCYDWHVRVSNNLRPVVTNGFTFFSSFIQVRLMQLKINLVCRFLFMPWWFSQTSLPFHIQWIVSRPLTAGWQGSLKIDELFVGPAERCSLWPHVVMFTHLIAFKLRNMNTINTTVSTEVAVHSPQQPKGLLQPMHCRAKAWSWWKC